MSTTVGDYDESTGCNKFTMTLQGTDNLLRDMLIIQEEWEWGVDAMGSAADTTDGYRVEVL